jgi:hypothetical protein
MSMVNTADVQGGIVSRAIGGNSERLQSEELSERFDNIDVYRMMHENLFGVFPGYPEGQRAPDRGAEAAMTMPDTGGVRPGDLLGGYAWLLVAGLAGAAGLAGLLVLRYRLR